MKKTTVVEWSPALLDNGARKTQSEWIKWCANKKLNPQGWRLPTLNEYNDLNKNLKNDEFGKALKKHYKIGFLMTANTLFDPFTQSERALVLGRDDVGRFIIGAVAYYGPARGVRNKKRDEK